MKEDTEQLDEVVVTALGIKRSQKALSYNVQEVKNDVLTKVKDANFVNSLNGKVAGVSIQRSASGVGGGTRVVMRGNKSIKGDNNVLYVIDGVPMGNQADRTGDGTGFGAGRTSSEGIASFNPEDIEKSVGADRSLGCCTLRSQCGQRCHPDYHEEGAAGKVSVNVSSSAEFSNPFVLPRFQNTYGNVSGELPRGEKNCRYLLHIIRPTSSIPEPLLPTLLICLWEMTRTRRMCPVRRSMPRVSCPTTNTTATMPWCEIPPSSSTIS